MQLTPSGIVVSDINNGPVGTYGLPAQAAAEAPPTQVPVATIAGQVISAAPGASTLVINGQVLTASGHAITLAGTNDVATLGPDILAIQFPSGGVSTYALPSLAPSAAGIAGTVAGYSIAAAAGASFLIIGSQTVSVGGLPITLANNDVVSLGPSGLAMQMPGGGVSTITMMGVPSLTSATLSSGNRVASAIASSMSFSSLRSRSFTESSVVIGAPSMTSMTSTLASTSESGISPTPVITSSGNKVIARRLFNWMVGCVLAGLICRF